ncbi:MAG: lmo0937 family membrane protein [Bacteroidales bacterium]|nr:lmo0937 family membrane protein [Bacteroidales bacterium]MDD4150315.1 lmo0937 family membrane protein [Bacteroidales bacterium]MDY0140566.1 lmo0937 family membrane protein [Bacteroidales bacterium]
MKNNLTYVFTLILFVIWGTAFFMYDAGYMIHILLVIAFFPILIRVIRGKEFYVKKTEDNKLENNNI